MRPQGCTGKAPAPQVHSQAQRFLASLRNPASPTPPRRTTPTQERGLNAGQSLGEYKPASAAWAFPLRQDFPPTPWVAPSWPQPTHPLRLVGVTLFAADTAARMPAGLLASAAPNRPAGSRTRAPQDLFLGDLGPVSLSRPHSPRRVVARTKQGRNDELCGALSPLEKGHCKNVEKEAGTRTAFPFP